MGRAATSDNISNTQEPVMPQGSMQTSRLGTQPSYEEYINSRVIMTNEELEKVHSLLTGQLTQKQFFDNHLRNSSKTVRYNRLGQEMWSNDPWKDKLFTETVSAVKAAGPGVDVDGEWPDDGDDDGDREEAMQGRVSATTSSTTG
jgi:hypothetical protein